jgi:Fanconi anemia group M protein
MAFETKSAWSELKPYSDLVNTAGMEPRQYQISIIKSIESGASELIVLPTGLGKTIIAMFAIAMALYKGKRAIMLAPTKPLSIQHYESAIEILKLNPDEILLLTGTTKASKRLGSSAKAKVIIGTPQTISNDLQSGRMSMEDFGIAVLDECHHAVGRYAYTYIANECRLKGVQLVGLTASPGSDRKKITDLIDTLGVARIEAKSSFDPDVAPYIKGNDTETIYVENSAVVKSIAAMLKPLINQHLRKLYETGLSPSPEFDKMPKKRLLMMGDHIKRLNSSNYKFAAIFHYVYVLDLLHAYDLALTEGLYPFVNYIDGLRNRDKKSKVVESILKNQQLINAVNAANSAIDAGEEHPKMLELLRFLKNGLDGKSAMVFAQYRSTIRSIVKLLTDNGVKAHGFVGRKEGVKQSEQDSIINAFRNGEFNVLVATSVGEEGLDIPAVDYVIFYEPIPSEIRSIQRKGRTGRFRIGKVMILVAKDTKDEAYLMISRIREKRMFDTIIKLKEQIENGRYKPGKKKGQTRLKNA